MSDDKFMASLLSENSNGSCAQAKHYLPCVENEPCESELSFKGLIVPENNVNGVAENGHAQDLISSVKETSSSDKNGHFDDSTENSKNEEAKCLPGDDRCSTTEKGIDEECNNQTERDVNSRKETVVNNEADNAVNSLSTSDSFIGADSKIDSEAISQKYRDDLDSSDDDTSSTFSLGSSSDCSDSFLEKMHRSCSPGTKIPNIKTKGELDLDELPLIEELTIDVTEREMQKVGSIYAIVDKLVIVRALKDLQPLDLDSVLFLSYKNPLGRIFDVFGPVVEPFYSIRFNSAEHIVDKCVAIDADVFFAPEKRDITSYVFVDQLRKQKGSDASWQDNNEPPEEYLDYSDDDEERAAKRKRQAKNRSRHLEDEEVQVIPIKVPRDSKQKDPEKIHPWVDIQKYKQCLSQPPPPPPIPNNPFRTPHSHPASQGVATPSYARPSMAVVMTSKYTPERYVSLASQGGTNAPQRFVPQQNVAAHPQSMGSPSPAQFPFRLPMIAQQRTPVAESSPTFFQSHPPLAPHLIQSRPPLTLLQSPPPQPPLQVLPFGYHPQGQPFMMQQGMPPNHIFGQVPYFNQPLQSPMGVPPPAASPVAFAFRPDLGNHNPNFMNQPPNYTSQGLPFNQPANFVSQSSNFASQNSVMAQAPVGAQWQQGPPSPYGISPLSVSIPNTPPPNAIRTPISSPYNMWGNKSLNFPQSGYFGNM